MRQYKHFLEIINFSFPVLWSNDFLFSLCQIISLWNSRLSLACDILRSCYEAFALYSFGSYLVACLGKLHISEEQWSLIGYVHMIVPILLPYSISIIFLSLTSLIWLQAVEDICYLLKLLNLINHGKQYPMVLASLAFPDSSSLYNSVPFIFLP